jgi:hypothetical protein
VTFSFSRTPLHGDNKLLRVPDGEFHKSRRYLGQLNNYKRLKALKHGTVWFVEQNNTFLSTYGPHDYQDANMGMQHGTI